MQPNQPQYSIDYLNQIAPEQKKPGMDNRLFFAIIGVCVIVAVIVGGLMLASSAGPSGTTRLSTLAARLTTLQKISENATKNITSNQLQSVNSNLTIQLTNANRDITEPLTKNNIDMKKINKSITAKEDGSKLTTALDDARLNAVYDRTYAREMSYQLATVLALMKEIDNGSSSKSIESFVDTTTKNLDPVAKQLASFSEA